MGDVTERVRGNDGRMDLPTLTISAGSGWLDQRERFSNNIAGTEQKNYTLLRKGELSYNHGNSKLAKYGAVFELTNYEEALVPRIYHSFKTNEDSSSCFIEYMFATKKPDRELGKLVSSGARMDGLLNINFDEFIGINITLPSISEQEKISKFLRKLDFTITLHQRKLDKLKQLKQGYLQQLFPKPGETVPKIRFANFEAYWQERKLGELTQIKTGSGDLQDADSNGKFPFFVRSNNIEKSNRYIFDGEAVLIPGEGRLGDIYHYINGKFDYHQRVYKISNFSDSNMCGRFVLYELRRNFKRHALKFTVKATVDSLRLPILKNYKMKFPETQEQINIGNFLSELDIYIDFSQKRLTKLKICKKAFLQEMFL